MFTRGVKVIGSTSHYVIADLDAGPIIAQDVADFREAMQWMLDQARKGQTIPRRVAWCKCGSGTRSAPTRSSRP